MGVLKSTCIMISKSESYMGGLKSGVALYGVMGYYMQTEFNVVPLFLILVDLGGFHDPQAFFDRIVLSQQCIV